MVTFGALQSEYQDALFSVSSWNKKMLSRTEPNSPGSRRPHGVWFSETRLLLRLQEPLSQDHTALLDLPLPLGVKSKGTRMGDHDSIEVNVIKDSGWWPHWPTWRMFTGPVRETPPEESAVNDSFYAHTHASFTHLKNGATLSAKALFYCLVKKPDRRVLSLLAGNETGPNVLPGSSYSSLKNEEVICTRTKTKQNTFHSHKKNWAPVN